MTWKFFRLIKFRWLRQSWTIEEPFRRDKCTSTSDEAISCRIFKISWKVNYLDYLKCVYLLLLAPRRRKILQWIYPEPYIQHHQQTKSDVLSGTGEWLLSHPDFQKWKESVSSICGCTASWAPVRPLEVVFLSFWVVVVQFYLMSYGLFWEYLALGWRLFWMWPLELPLGGRIDGGVMTVCLSL